MISLLIGIAAIVLTSCSTLSSTTAPSTAGVVPSTGIPLVHGHRGSRGTHPENSLPAFQEAVEAGADFLEMDVHVSADKVLMVTHDFIINRDLCKHANGQKIRKKAKLFRIRNLTAAEIQKFDCGSVQNRRFPEQKTVARTPIPTLEEVLSWVAANAPKVQLNIETKLDEPRNADNPDPKEFATSVLELVKKHDLLDRVVIQSFDHRILAEAKKLESGVRLSALVAREKNFCEIAVKAGADIASPESPLVSAERVKKCHEQGIRVIPWTSNSEAEWKKLVQFGVDGIITDYPRKLVKFLKPEPGVSR